MFGPLVVDSEWEVVAVVCHILRPFAEATRVTSKSPIQFVRVVSYHIHDHIMDVCERNFDYMGLDDSFLKAMQDANNKFSKYYLQMDKSNLVLGPETEQEVE